MCEPGRSASRMMFVLVDVTALVSLRYDPAKKASLAYESARRAAGESDCGKIAARKPHVAEESGRENDVSCTCQLCIAHDYYAKRSVREKSGKREDVPPKGSCSVSQTDTFGAQ